MWVALRLSMELVSEKLWRRFSTKGMWVDVIGHALVSRAAEARTEYAVRAEGTIRFWLIGIPSMISGAGRITVV